MMRRVELNAAQRAINETIKRYEAAGLDSFALRQEADRLAQKAERIARDGEKPVSHRRLMDRAPDNTPPPDRTITVLRPDDDIEQRAYESVFRLMDVAIATAAAALVPAYGPRRVRVALNGALRRLAEMLPERDEFRIERERVNGRMLHHGD